MIIVTHENSSFVFNMLLLQISELDIKVRNVQLANVFTCEAIVTRAETEHSLLMALFWLIKVHISFKFRF